MSKDKRYSILEATYGRDPGLGRAEQRYLDPPDENYDDMISDEDDLDADAAIAALEMLEFIANENSMNIDQLADTFGHEDGEMFVDDVKNLFLNDIRLHDRLNKLNADEISTQLRAKLQVD